jgi:phospholipid/cholesterol/gamma-HCH transport system permease protein
MWQSTLKLLDLIGEYVLLTGRVLKVSLRRPPSWILIRDQMYSIGFLSFGVVAITGFATGLVLSAQSIFQLTDKGLAAVTGIMVTKGMITELGPILTAFMVTGRVGAAICAELGTMKVSEQIDALQSMSVNPLRYLIAPRFIAAILMFPILTIFNVLMGIFGAYLLAIYFFGMPPMTFLAPLPDNVTNFDILVCFVKSVCFAVIIVTVSCYKGINTKGGAAGVGSSTTNSVVLNYSIILIVNFLLTLGMNLFHSKFWGGQL